MPDRPNLLLILSDEHSPHVLGCAGDRIVRTPHLDRLAREGRRLTSFYAAPVCSPSRASLMTGCYPKRALSIPHVLFPADRKSTRLNSSHLKLSRMPSSA